MLFLLFISLVPLVFAKNELYMGYKVYNVKFSTQEQQENFHLLKTDIIDYWVKPNLKYGITGLAMVPPSQFNYFEERLKELDLEIDVEIDDVYEYLLQKESKVKARKDDYSKRVNTNDADDSNDNDDNEDINESDSTDENEASEEDQDSSFDYDDFYRYNEILDHIYQLKDLYENATNISLDVVEFGTTENNRPLVYLSITSGNSEVNKPVVVIEAGVNPREWITIPSALNIVDKVLEENQARFLDNFHWIVIPVVNPDGYEYTHTDLRFWEKNLSTKSSWGVICPGVNINRNFDIDWSNSDSSSSPCSHLYAGDEAFSEIETRLVQSIIETYKNRISLYVSLQNKIGFISYPWQYEFAASGMFRQNHLLGMKMLEAMQEGYGLDSASVALGDRASGTSSDFARENNVLYAFNIDIVRRGTDGVIVPENEIVNIVEDVWRAVVVAADYLIE